MQIGPFHLSSSAHRLACSNRRMKEKAGCLYAVCLKSDGTVPTKYFTISAQGFQCRTPGIPAFPANFPFSQCHPCAEREALSTFSKRASRFKHVFLFRFTATQHSASLFTCLGCLSIFFFNTRHTAQGRNTARGVPAFSDRLFGKCNPRNLPLKLPSMAGIIFHSTNALPKARQASSAASSDASQQVTLSHTRFSPASPQSFSQLRIHSPSPQP